MRSGKFYGPCLVGANAAGPGLYLPLPSIESAAVGRIKDGPTRQMSPPVPACDRNRVGLMSPRPKSKPCYRSAERTTHHFRLSHSLVAKISRDKIILVF
jgi:hypothetical protein